LIEKSIRKGYYRFTAITSHRDRSATVYTEIFSGKILKVSTDVCKRYRHFTPCSRLALAWLFILHLFQILPGHKCYIYIPCKETCYIR